MAPRYGYEPRKTDISITPNIQNRAPRPKIHRGRVLFLGAVATTSGALGFGIGRGTAPHHSETSAVETTTPATAMVQAPDKYGATIWDVAREVHRGDVRTTVDDIQRLHHGSSEIQPREELAVPKADINKPLPEQPGH